LIAMSRQNSPSKKSRLIEDQISVEDILLEYVIDNGWKDYDRFARKLTEKILDEAPSRQEDLEKLVRGFIHPFFAFNNITKEQFVSRFPLAELLRQSRIPRGSFDLVRQRRLRRRRMVSKKLRFMILERDKYRCRICGKSANETKLEVDHKVPVAKGGTDSLDNLWTLCIDCNRGKSDLSI